MSLSEDRIARRWTRGRMTARIYDYGVQREGLARPLARLVWGDDARHFYADVAALKELPEGSSVLDVPCGGGVAFRGLDVDASIRYVAADVSPFMLERARAEAARRGIENIEYVETRVERMPFEDSTFDLCVSYNGLHCFSDPPAAAAEIVRVLRPGGRLRGTAIVTDGGLVSAAFIKFLRRTDQFGPVGTVADVRRWLTDAGLVQLKIEHRGAYTFFNGRRPGEKLTF